MLLAFGICNQSPLTCLLSASTIHHQELVLSKKRRKKKSTKIMTAGLIPSKIQALSMEASVRQMPHSGSPPIPGSTGGKTDTLQSQHDKRIRIRLSLYIWLPLLNLTGRQWEWLLEDRWGKKMASKTKHRHYPGLNTTQSGPPWSWFVSLDADFLTCHLWTEL